MPVTELALLKMVGVSTHDIPSDGGIPTERYQILHKAMSEQAAYSGYPVALLQSTTDFAQIFLVGGWESVSHHMDDWILGPINQNLLKLLSSHVEVEWMFHLDLNPSQAFEAVHRDEGLETVPASLELYIVNEGQKSECEALLRDDGSEVESGEASRSFRGWRADSGYVPESARPDMREVGNMIVSFAAGKNGQSLVPEELDDYIREKIVYSTTTIAFVDKDERTNQ